MFICIATRARGRSRVVHPTVTTRVSTAWPFGFADFHVGLVEVELYRKTVLEMQRGRNPSKYITNTTLCFIALRAMVINTTRTALGRAHLPPTTVFRRLKTTRHCCDGRQITIPNTCTWDFPDVIKFRALQCVRYRRKQSGSGIQTMIRIGLKSWPVRPNPDICRHGKCHPHPCTRLWVILLTDRQTNRQTSRAIAFTTSVVGQFYAPQQNAWFSTHYNLQDVCVSFDVVDRQLWIFSTPIRYGRLLAATNVPHAFLQSLCKSLELFCKFFSYAKKFYYASVGSKQRKILCFHHVSLSVCPVVRTDGSRRYDCLKL